MNDALADISRLICAAREDDPGAVDQLLRVYQNYLSLLARNWLDTALIRRVDASDVVQETLLKAHAKFCQFRGRSEGELAAWLRQILARTVTDLARRHRAAIREMNRERSLEQSFDNSARALDRVLAASGTSPSKAAERREQGVILANALAGLPPDYREFFRSVANLGIQAAEALHYAHEMSVVHRDIKPSNLMLDAEGHLSITDFGLAMTRSDANLTMTGDLLGTLRYMSPEQTQGKHGVVDQRTDIYSLGATLYELMTLEPAVDGDNRAELIRKINDEQARRPRRLNRAIPKDLETIVLKALAKEADKRYTTAQDLADDLRRFVEDEPIKARPVGRTERVWRWSRRNPVISGLTAAVFVTVLAAILVLLNLWKVHREKRWEADLAEASRASSSGEVGQQFAAHDALVAASDIRQTPAVRDAFITAWSHDDLRPVWEQGSSAIRGDGVFFSDLEHFAMDDGRGGVSIRSVPDDRQLATLPASGKPLTAPLVSPNGRFVARKYTVEGQAECHVWNWEDQELILRAPASEAGFGMDFSPDSSSIAVIGPEGEIHVLDLATGEERNAIRTMLVPNSICYDPSGARIAAVSVLPASGSSTVNLVDPNQGKTLDDFPISATASGRVAWHPNGLSIAVPCQDGSVQIWDVDTHRRRMLLEGHTSPVVEVRFSHDGHRLASVSQGGLRLWDMASGSQLVRKPGPNHGGLQWGPADGRLAFRQTGRLQIWELATPIYGLIQPEGLPRQIKAGRLDVSPDARMLAAAVRDTVELRDIATGRLLAVLPVAQTRRVIFYSSGGGLFTESESGIRHWPLVRDPSANTLKIGPPVLFGQSEKDNSHVMDVSADGEWSATTTRAAQVTITRLADGKQRLLSSGKAPGEIEHVAISPSGKKVAASRRSENGVDVWDAQTNAKPRRLETNRTGAVLSFSPMGRWLVACTPKEYRIWETGAWTMVLSIAVDNAKTPRPASFFPGGEHVALCPQRNVVEIHDLAAKAVIARLESPSPAGISGLAFTPGGDKLILLRTDRRIGCWDMAEIGRRFTDVAFDWNWPSVGGAPHNLVAAPPAVELCLVDRSPTEKPPSRRNYVLQFDGRRAHVKIPTLHYDGSHPITVEAIVTSESNNPDSEPGVPHMLNDWEAVVSDGGSSGLSVHVDPVGFSFRVCSSRDDRPVRHWTLPYRGRQFHLAAVYDTEDCLFFVNGKLRGKSKLCGDFKASPYPLMIGAKHAGANKVSNLFRGVIDEVRVSSCARYADSFEPVSRLARDQDTLALYHFDEGSGNIVHDSSTHHHHGHIVDGEWVVEHPTPVATPEVPEPNLPKGAIDLLELVQVERDIVRGEWGFEEGTLISREEGVIQIPFILPDEYDLLLIGERIHGESALGVGVVLDGKQARARVDSEGRFTGLGNIDGAYPGQRAGQPDVYGGNVLQHNVPVNVKFEVRKSANGGSLRICQDDRELCAWQGESERLGRVTRFAPISGDVAFLTSADNCAFRIHALHLVPVSGDGQPIFSLDTSPASPDRVAAERILWKGGTVSISVDNGSPQTVDRIRDLPQAFRLVGVDLKSDHNRPVFDFSCLAQLKSLKRVSLSGSGIASVHDGAWLSAVGSLEEVDLNGLSVSQSLIDGIGVLPQLRKLAIRNTDVSEVTLSPLAGCKKLRNLNLSGSAVSDETLGRLSALCQLEKLDLRLTDVSDEGLTRLADCKALRTLLLAGTAVTDSCLQRYSNLGQLEELDLRGTAITDIGMEDVGRLANLRRLDLGFTPITDDGVKSLASLNALSYLSLMNTRVSDAGLKLLDNLSQLQQLDLMGTDVSGTGKAILGRKLTACTINHVHEEPVNLLSFIDVDRHAEKGNWKFVGGGFLEAETGGANILRIPYLLPHEYLLEILAKRKRGNSTLEVTVPVAGRPVTMTFGAPGVTRVTVGGHAGGLATGSQTGTEVFPRNKLVCVRILVKKACVVSATADRLLMDWTKESEQSNSLEDNREANESLRSSTAEELCLSTKGARLFAIKKVNLTPISGEGRRLEHDWRLPEAADQSVSPPSPSDNEIDLLTVIQPNRDSIQRECRLVDGTLVGGSSARLRIPYFLPEEYDLRLTLERLWGGKGLKLDLRVGRESRSLHLDALWDWTGFKDPSIPWPNPPRGAFRGRILRQGRPITIEVKVRRTADCFVARVLCEGRELTRLQTSKGSEPTSVQPLGFPEHAPRLDFRSGFRVLRMSVVPISGEGGVVSFDDDSDSVDHRTANLVLWKGGEIVAVTQSGERKVVQRISDMPPIFALAEIDLRSVRRFHGDDFAQLTDLKNLEKLALGNGRVTDEDVNHLTALTTIQELDLSCTAITDEALRLLKGLTGLERLDLSGTRLTDEGIKHLAELKDLKDLDLSWVTLTQEGLQHLAELPELQRLFLDCIPVTDDGVAHITRLADLRTVSLLNSRITYEGATSLLASSNVRELYLSNWDVTSDIEQIKGEAPDRYLKIPPTGPIELLPLVTPDEDSVGEPWIIDGQAFASPSGRTACLSIPYTPPTEYVLDIEAERDLGWGPLVIGLAAGTHRFVVRLEETAGSASYLDQVDGGKGTRTGGKGFTSGEPFSIRIVVRDCGVDVAYGRRLLIHWRGDLERLSLPNAWQIAGDKPLFIGVPGGSTFRISRFAVTPLSGQGRFHSVRNTAGAGKSGGEKPKEKSGDTSSDEKGGRYAVPDGGVDELLAFMEAVWQFKPGNDKERKEYQEKAFNAIHAAASRIHALENDPESEAVRKATMILLDFQIRLPGSRDRQQLAALIKAIADRGDLANVDMAEVLDPGSVLERNKQLRSAAKMYSTIVQVADMQEDERWDAIREIAEGAKRRLELVGKPFDLGGIQTDNTRFKWDEYRGKFVLVHFLTSWCIHCRNEIPNIRAYYDLYRDRGFDVVDISLDEDQGALRRYLDQEQLPWVTLHEAGKGWDSLWGRHYGIRAVPTMLLVDKEGKVVSLNARGAELGKLLAQLIGPAGAEAGVLARAKKWDQAARHYQALARLNPSSENHWRALVACRLQSNDIEGYGTACKEAFARLSRSHIWSRTKLVQLCAFGPNCGVDGEALSRIAADLLRQNDNAGMKLAKGMTDFRCGRFEEASANLPAHGDSLQVPCSLLFQAMANHRLGNTQQAQLLLRKSIQEIQSRVPTIDGPPLDSHLPERWIVWATVDAVRREAIAAISTDSEDADQANSALDVPKAIDELTVAIEKSGDDAKLFARRGGFNARLGHWKEAAADYVKAVELEPDNDIYWLRAAPLLALADDLEEYRRLCQQMIERFGVTKEPARADKTIKACLLLPGTEVPDSLRQVLETALDGGKAPKWFYGWGYATQALMSFRDGDAEDAVRWVRKSQETETYAEFGSLRAFALLLLSMAQHELEKEDEARKSYDEALKLVYDHLNEPIGDDPANIEHDWLIAQIIRREAEKRLEGKTTPQRVPAPK